MRRSKAELRDCAVCQRPCGAGDGSRMVLLPQHLGKARGGGQIRLCCKQHADQYERKGG